jgi:hypothetical protein
MGAFSGFTKISPAPMQRRPENLRKKGIKFMKECHHSSSSNSSSSVSSVFSGSSSSNVYLIYFPHLASFKGQTQ